MSRTAAAVVPTVERPWPIVAVAASSVFLVLLDTTVLFIVFPAIREAFPSSTPSTLSWAINAYTILFAALLVPAGRIADLKGRKLVFVVGLAIFTLGAILAGVAPGVGWLIAARAIQAVGAAAITPSALALALAAFPSEKRSLVIGVWGAASAVAAALGPVLGALVIEGAGWRWVFLAIAAPFAALFTLLAAKILPNPRATRAGDAPDVPSVVLLVAGVGCLAFGIVQTRVWAFTVPTLAALGLGIALLIVFVWDARRKPTPAIDVRLFAEPNFRNANIATFVYGAVFAMMFFTCLLFPQQVWKYSLTQSAVAFAPSPLLVIPSAIWSGRIATQYGHRALLIAGGFVFAAGGAWFYWIAPAYTSYWIGWFPGIAFIGVAVGMLITALTGAAVAHLVARDLGSGSGANQAIRQLGAVIGVALVVALVGQRSAGAVEFGHAFAALALGGVIVALLSLTIDTRPRAKANS
ncbi:MAG: MFS transporter [Sulfurifustis sp.]